MKPVPAIAMLLGGLILLWPGGVSPDPSPDPVPSDMVSEAFDTLERLWRQHAADAAGKLRSAEITSEQEIHRFLEAGQQPARKVAFAAIAAAEQEMLRDGWSAEKHAEILEGYSR